MELSQQYGSRRRRRGLTLVVAMVLVGLAAFAVYSGLAASPKASAGAGSDEPATVEPIGKRGRVRVVLTEPAAKRLDIKTARVSTTRVNGERQRVIPYDAVLYDPNGETWTYSNPRHLVFVRRNIRVSAVKGGLAVLSEGPRPGTAVVTVGSAELWGIEYGEIEED